MIRGLAAYALVVIVVLLIGLVVEAFYFLVRKLRKSE